MASPSTEETEKKIVKEFASRQGEKAANFCSGLSVNLYQIQNNAQRKWKVGMIFHATRKEALIFGGPGTNGCIEGETDCKREARFLVQELSERKKAEDMMVQALHVNHMGILKLRMVSYNSQISKMVSGYGICDCTLTEWLANQPISRDANVNYLSANKKLILRTAVLTIAYIWTSTKLSSDVLDDPNSYIMADGKLKILDSCLRSRKKGDTIVMMLSGFADVVLKNILPKWMDVEIADFAALLKNPFASQKDILGHPILLTPVERELLYHAFDTADLNQRQKVLVNRIQVPNKWQTDIRTVDIVNDIFVYQINQKDYAVQILRKPVFAFSNDTSGAIHLGAVMSAHYVEHVRYRHEDSWTTHVQMNTVDLLLKVHLPRVLTRRYGLKYNDQFRQQQRL